MSREVFVLLEDGDMTMWSGPEPFGFAVTKREDARIFSDSDRHFKSYSKVIVCDSLDEVNKMREARRAKRRAEMNRLAKENPAHIGGVPFRSPKNRVVPDSEFSKEEKGMLGNGETERKVIEVANYEEPGDDKG